MGCGRKGRETELPPFLLPIRSLSNQIRNDHIPVAILLRVVESENVLSIVVTKDVVIYEEESEWKPRLGNPLNVCHVLVAGFMDFQETAKSLNHTYLYFLPSLKFPNFP